MTVLVAVRLNVSLRSTPKLVVNRITSLNGKEKIDKLVQHPMLYVNTAKAHRWMVVRGLQLPTKTKLSAGSTGKILTPEDLVKFKMERVLSFSMERAGLRAPDVLMGRADERAGEVPRAGEIEVRNVQSRMGWPMAERKVLNILDWGMRMF